MNLIESRFYSHVEIEYDRGDIKNGDTSIIPVGKSPLEIGDSLNILSGWPLRYVFPNIHYESRYNLDVNMLLEDLALGDAKLLMPRGLRWHNLDKFHSAQYTLNISNLRLSWNLMVPEGIIQVEDQENRAYFTDMATVTNNGYYTRDNGVDLTDPTGALLTNHYVCKYAGLDRGYGRMKHGWFYVETAGNWLFAVDGNDVVEIAIDDGVVAAKYTNSGPAGTTVLNGNIDLAVGWHHMFAYTSDRSNSGYPLIWFQRPGDTSWTTMTTGTEDGLQWNRTSAKPRATRFRSNAGNITATLEFDDTHEVGLTFVSSLLTSGNIGVTLDTLPRYRPYYWWNWRESSFGAITEPETLPPIFEDMRGIMAFQPNAEMLCYTESHDTTGISPRFAITHDDTINWYIWDGTSFNVASISSVSELLNQGNSLSEVNAITDTDWASFLPNTTSVVKLMFTGPPPLALTSNRKVFQNMTGAEYLLGTKAHIPAAMRVERREI